MRHDIRSDFQFRWFCFLSSVQTFQQCQHRRHPFLEIFCNKAGHGFRRARGGIVFERLVVSLAVGELDVDGREAGLHQLHVEQQASRAAVAVDKGMDALEAQVSAGCTACSGMR